MILPAQLLLLFIVVFPLLMQIYISLTYWGPTDGVSWIYAYQSLNLFDNYVTFFTDGGLWAAIARTLFIMAVAVPLEFLLGLGLATLFVDNFPGRRIFYSILLTPMMVVPAVAGYMFYMLFQSNGPVNQILSCTFAFERRIGMAERAASCSCSRHRGRRVAMDAAGFPDLAGRDTGGAGGSAQGGDDARRKLAAAFSSDRFAAHANGYHHCAYPSAR